MGIPYGEIKILFTGITKEKTLFYKEIIDRLLESGVFNTKNGKVILNFDNEGLAEIELQVKQWKRGKELKELSKIEQYRVEMNPVDKSTFAYRT